MRKGTTVDILVWGSMVQNVPEKPFSAYLTGMLVHKIDVFLAKEWWQTQTILE